MNLFGDLDRAKSFSYGITTERNKTTLKIKKKKKKYLTFTSAEGKESRREL